MKFASVGKLPWDMVVFLTITTAGFGLSVKRLVYSDAQYRAIQLETSFRQPASAGIGRGTVLDFGCLETLTTKQNRSLTDRTVRLKGKLCYSATNNNSADNRFDLLVVKNITTGVESTVFFRNNESAFLTDQLILQSGKNIIEIKWRDAVQGDDKMVVTEVYGK